MINLYLLILA